CGFVLTSRHVDVGIAAAKELANSTVKTIDATLVHIGFPVITRKAHFIWEIVYIRQLFLDCLEHI
ncbi:hypothetical protein CW702_00660, partial [Candidatus Bathyarchaeota archaeon]